MPVRLHLRRSAYVVLGPVLTATWILLALGASFPLVSSNADIAAVMNGSLAVLAPLIAGSSAWDCLRDRRHGGAPLLDTSFQAPARIALVQGAVALAFVSAGFLVTLTALYIRATALFVLSDEPRILTLVITLLTSWSAALIGTTVGLWIRHWSAVILAALLLSAVYAATLAPGANALIRSMIPFGRRVGDEFIEPNNWYLVGQLMFLVGCVALLAASIALGSAAERWMALAAGLAGFVMIVSGAVVLSVQGGRWGDPVEDPARAVRAFALPDGSLTLGLQPQYEPIASSLLAAWSRVQRTFSETPIAFDRLDHVSSDHPVTVPVARLDRLYLNASTPTPTRDSILESLVDIHPEGCASFSTSLVDNWLAGVPRGSLVLTEADEQRYDFLNSLAVEQSQSWMRMHYADYAGCTLEDSAFSLP